MSGQIERWNRVFEKSGQIVTRKIADETLVVPIRGELANMQRIFSLNPVAEFVWEHLDGERSLEDIRREVISCFDVAKELAETDILEFIDELIKAELIR